MIAVVDYDMGNLRSVEKALLRVGQEACVTRDPERIRTADGVVLPGVGAFGACMANLEGFGLVPVLQRVIDRGTPFLGICLGAQMLVNHLGGRVAGHHEGLVEIGWYPLKATEEGKALMHWPEMVYQFHREGFSLPSGAKLLATADSYPNQAFRYGDKAYGIQFHPEVGREVMQRWIVEAAHMLVEPGAQSGEEQLAGCARHDAAMAEWLRQFLIRWMA